MATYYNDNGDLKLISGATLWADAPIGAINAYGGITAPSGWLLCQGQAISRIEYAELFAVIGTAYGSGDGSTTFNLPDPREAALVGAGTNVLNAGSIAAHNAVSLGAFQDDQTQKMEGDIGEVFNFTAPSGVFKLGSASPTGFVGDGQYNPYNVQMDTSKAARTGTTTHGKQLGVNYIIKAKQVALPADFMEALDDKQDSTDNSLETTDKTVVGAVNELNSSLTEKTTINEEIGSTFAKTPTYDGRLLLNKMYGMSVQDGTPTPSVPVEIQSAKANFKCVGKNLIPYPYYHASGRESNGITYIVNSDGSITADGSNTTSSSSQFDLCDNIKSILKPNTTYKLNSNGGILNTCQIFIDYQTISSTWSTLAVSSNKEVTFTTPQDFSSIAKFRVMMSVSAGKSVSNLTIKPMFTLGEVSDTSYKPYKSVQQSTDLTLRAIEVSSSNDYNLEKDGKYYIADTLDWSEDNGYVVTRRVEHLDFDSTWYSISFDESGKFFTYYLPNDKPVSPNFTFATNWAKTNSNRFIEGAIATTSPETLGLGGIIVSNNYCRVGVDSTVATSLEDVRTWIANNPLYIEYILQTPTTESITSEQAQALLGLKTYDEATYVTQTEDVEGTMVLKYGSSDFATTVLSAYVEGKENELKTSELNNNLADISTDGTIKSVIWQDLNIQENLNREVPFVMPEDGYVVARAGAGNNSSTSMLTLIITINNTLRVASLLLEEPYAEAAISSPYIKKGTQVLINVVLTAASWTNETKGIVDFTVI